MGRLDAVVDVDVDVDANDLCSSYNGVAGREPVRHNMDDMWVWCMYITCLVYTACTTRVWIRCNTGMHEHGIMIHHSITLLPADDTDDTDVCECGDVCRSSCVRDTGREDGRAVR